MTPHLSSTSTIPDDMWLCCHCSGGNLIALTDNACPVCTHYRCSLCAGPGATYSTMYSSFCFQSSHAHENSTKHYNNDYSNNTSGQHPCFYSYSHSHSHSYSTHVYLTSPPSTTFNGAGSPAPGAWLCSQCGAANSDLTPDFCPVCGCGR